MKSRVKVTAQPGSRSIAILKEIKKLFERLGIKVQNTDPNEIELSYEASQIEKLFAESSNQRQTHEGSIPVKSITLAAFNALHHHWTEHNFPNATPWEPLVGMVEELGELAHAHLKGVQSIRHTAKEIHKMKIDAIGDILVYLSHYCRLQNIDPEEALWTAWLQIKDRDWKKNPLNAATVVEGGSRQEGIKRAAKVMNHPSDHYRCPLCNQLVGYLEAYQIPGQEGFFHAVCASAVVKHGPTFKQPKGGEPARPLGKCTECNEYFYTAVKTCLAKNGKGYCSGPPFSPPTEGGGENQTKQTP